MIYVVNSFNRCLKYINFWRKLFCYPHFDPREHLIENIWTGLPVAGLFKAQWPPPSWAWAFVLSLERQRAVDTLAQQGRAWVPGAMPGSRCPAVLGLGHQGYLGGCGPYRLAPRGCPNAQPSVPSSSLAAFIASRGWRAKPISTYPLTVFTSDQEPCVLARALQASARGREWGWGSDTNLCGFPGSFQHLGDHSQRHSLVFRNLGSVGTPRPRGNLP